MGHLWAVICISAAALLFSTGGAAIKLATLSPAQIACFRSGIAALVLVALAPEARARRGATALGRALVVGCAFAATMLLYVAANRTTTAANAVFLQASAPLYLLVLGPLLLREHARRGDLAVLLVMALGLALFFVDPGRPQGTAPDPLLGNLLAAASGLTWALTVLGLRWLGRSGGATLQAVVLGNALAFLVALPFALQPGTLGVRDAAVLLWLGVFQIALAYVFAARGIRGVHALEASLLFLLEPALNPVWAWLVHGEEPGAWTLAGGVVILGAGLYPVLRARRVSARSPGPA